MVREDARSACNNTTSSEPHMNANLSKSFVLVQHTSALSTSPCRSASAASRRQQSALSSWGLRC